MDEYQEPELLPGVVPWGNTETPSLGGRDLKLVELIRGDFHELSAITARFSGDKKTIMIHRWEWENNFSLGREWTPGDGKWVLKDSNRGTLILTISQFEKVIAMAKEAWGN